MSQSDETDPPAIRVVSVDVQLPKSAMVSVTYSEPLDVLELTLVLHARHAGTLAAKLRALAADLDAGRTTPL